MIAVNLFVANSTPIPLFNYHVRIIWCQHKSVDNLKICYFRGKIIHFNPKVGFDLLSFKDSFFRPTYPGLNFVANQNWHWQRWPSQIQQSTRCSGDAVFRCEQMWTWRNPTRWIGLISFSSEGVSCMFDFCVPYVFFLLRGFQVYPGSQRCH